MSVIMRACSGSGVVHVYVRVCAILYVRAFVCLDMRDVACVCVRAFGCALVYITVLFYARVGVQG